jgi:hypothetical protein
MVRENYGTREDQPDCSKGYDRWLQPGDPDRPPIDLLRPFDAHKMTAWKVDKAVGNVKNDSADLMGSVSVEMDAGRNHPPVASLFPVVLYGNESSRIDLPHR